MWSSAEAVTGWVKGMIDAAIIAGIAAAAGTITAETAFLTIVRTAEAEKGASPPANIRAA